MRENTWDTTTNSRTSITTFQDTTAIIHTSTQTSSSPGAMATIAAIFPKRLARFVLVTCLLVTIAIVYVTLFKHPPPDQVLKMNGGGGNSFNMRAFGNLAKSRAAGPRALKRSENEAEEDENGVVDKGGNVLDMFDDDEDDGSDEDKHKSKPLRKAAAAEPERKDTGEIKGKAAWDKFIADNHHTVIGVVFDRCEEATEQLGTVVLLPDTKNGGVMSRTFYNFTLDREIDEGWTFNIDVKYNGQDLYDNWWEVCEMEEDLDPEDRTFICPVRPGKLSLVKDKHIPGYIPKGRYLTKAWVKDSNNTVLLCGYSDFVL